MPVLPTNWTLRNGIVLNDYLASAGGPIGILLPDTGGTNFRFASRPLTSVTYTLIVTLSGLVPEPVGSNPLAFGVFLSDGTKVIAFELLNDGSVANNQLQVRQASTVTVGGTVVAGPTVGVLPRTVATFKIQQDATFRTFSYFTNGTWVQFYQEAAGAFLTETELGIGGFSNGSNAELSVLADLRRWEFTSSEVTFLNDRVPGLTHIEITLSDDTVEPWSVIPMDDPVDYDYGRKVSRVLAWGEIRRAVCDFYGVAVAADFRFTVRDKDLHVLGYLGDPANVFTNRYTVTRSISDPDRRQRLTRRVVFRGPIRSVQPRAGATHEFTVKDYLQERFGPNSDLKSIPRRKVLVDDFPGCDATLVNSSAEQYTVNGAHVIGNTDIAVHAGVGTFALDTIVFGNHAQQYQISASTIDDPETQITVNPPLVSNVPDGTTITQIPTHTVTPAKGAVAPVRAGLITDLKIVAGEDQGDGQGKVQYVGDELQADGFIYGMFLWACHGCYSPSGKPIQQLYFWNNAMEGSASGVLFDQGFQPILTAIGDLATEAGSGGRVLLPGYANWTDNLYSGSYDDRNGRRWVWIGLRGILRDWALGIRQAPMNLGGVPFCVNGYGMDSTLDGTGTEVRDLHDQFVLAFNNFAYGDYQSGAPAADPVFPDDPSLTLLDLASIARAKAHGATLVSGGFRGDWSLGVDNEQITMQEFLKRAVTSMGVEQSWNRKTQWCVDRQIFNETDAMADAPTLTDERDIRKLSFEIDERPNEQFTALKFVHTRDELGRSTGGWRSATADTNVADAADEFADVDATITKYSPNGAKLYSQPLQFYMLRGKNRTTDADEYQQGSDTINTILSYKLALSKVRVFSLTTWGKGYSIEIFDRIWIQHLANVGGRVPRPARVIEHNAQPDRWRVTLKCFDLAGLPGFLET